MKVSARFYRGIEYVKVEELPADQQLLLKHSTEPERIKILIDGRTFHNCLQYKDYETWYLIVFKRSIAPAKQPTRIDKSVAVKLSFSKG